MDEFTRSKFHNGVVNQSGTCRWKWRDWTSLSHLWDCCFSMFACVCGLEGVKVIRVIRRAPCTRCIIHDHPNLEQQMAGARSDTWQMVKCCGLSPPGDTVWTCKRFLSLSVSCIFQNNTVHKGGLIDEVFHLLGQHFFVQTIKHKCVNMLRGSPKG